MHPSYKSLDLENSKIVDTRSSFHRFLDRLSVERFVDYVTKDGSNNDQIQRYFELRDVRFLNDVVEEARLRCVYDRDLHDRLMQGVLGRYL